MNKIIMSFGIVLISLASLAQTTVVDVVVDSEDHTILEAAVLEAGLVEALSETTGTFTVFAPTDNAFITLASQLNVEVEDLLELPNLADILLYHVLPEVVLEEVLLPFSVFSMWGTLLPDAPMYIQSNGTTINVNGNSWIITADLIADNGVVHVIDAVVFPTNNNPVGIGEIEASDVQFDGLYYNIMGQVIRSYEEIPLNSFYIRNGKKFIKTVQ
ncbi:fasciclin domain-containing protein [Crocinitomicaceae bacterium]|nr:fasciclin domain-containing protein [Crocinitomicaceae bacterium]